MDGISIANEPVPSGGYPSVDNGRNIISDIVRFTPKKQLKTDENKNHLDIYQ